MGLEAKRPSILLIAWAFCSLSLAKWKTRTKVQSLLEEKNTLRVAPLPVDIGVRWRALIAVSNRRPFTCLHRAIAFGRWLEGKGIGHRLEIAWLKQDAHAWIEIPSVGLFFGVTAEEATKLRRLTNAPMNKGPL